MRLVISMTFQKQLDKLGFKNTTPIQDGVFNAFHKGGHIVGLAPTGTGKTHAYLLPVMSALDPGLQAVQAVVIVPTNELVRQVERMLLAFEDRFVVKAYVGGSDRQREMIWLGKRQPQIVIATPERLHQFVIREGALKINMTRHLIFDEADMMFDEAFMSLIDPLLEVMTKARIMLFSATLTPAMRPFIKSYFGAHHMIDVTKAHDLPIEYRLINIKGQDRLEALMGLLPHLQPYLALIFVSRKDTQQLVYEALHEKGIAVCNLHADLGVKRRRQLLDDIIALKYPYVVTSDLASRGLDLKVSHVIHFDLPHQLAFFFHRSGRTGRMHDDGIVITFMTVNDHRRIEKLKQRGIEFVPYGITADGLVEIKKRVRSLTEDERHAMKAIKKPVDIKPNYKKKNKKKVAKAIRKTRRKPHA